MIKNIELSLMRLSSSLRKEGLITHTTSRESKNIITILTRIWRGFRWWK